MANENDKYAKAPAVKPTSAGLFAEYKAAVGVHVAAMRRAEIAKAAYAAIAEEEVQAGAKVRALADALRTVIVGEQAEAK